MDKLTSSNQTWSPSGKSIYVTKIESLSEEKTEVLQKTKKLNLNQDPAYIVTGVELNVSIIPENLKFFFPNLSVLKIHNGPLKKITKSDLRSLTMLNEIYITYTYIEELPADLFEDMKSLKIINLCFNRIKFIGKGIFDNLKQLEYVDLRRNPSIDLLYTNVYEHYNKMPNYESRIVNLAIFRSLINRIYHTTPQVLLDIQNALKNENSKDFTVKINENEFKVHKFILTARSPTLAVMIKNNPDADELILEDIEVEVFKIILDFIYDDKTPNNCDENSEKVFAAAGKLKLDLLMKEVGNILSVNLKPEKSFEVLKLASQFNHEELKRKSFEEVKMYLNDENLKDELMENLELLTKLIDAKKSFEEMMRKMKEEVEKAMAAAEDVVEAKKINVEV
jgi:predicted house-cleaning noncanonical NTP pyrophosphatase (MazG superfamily)